MTLKPTDMLEIQSAIDAYERKFPRRPEPSATAALKWRLGKREWARRLARNPELALDEKKPEQTSRDSEEGLVPWVRKALLVGWWGVIAVVVASVFFFGALVGGFK
jgi:hypothetical protein